MISSQYNIQYKPSFTALKVAKTRNMMGSKTIDIDLYKLEKSDRPFLKKLVETIDFSKLYPKLNILEQARWDNIFKYCITSAFEPLNNTYIAIHNGKPCGILTYLLASNSIYLDGICSIPTETNKKVKFTGKTLFYQLFRDAKNKNVRDINLDAVKNGPFDVIKKYEKLGFKKDPTTHPYTKMVCNKHKISEQLKELPYEIEYFPIEQSKVDLNQFID